MKLHLLVALALVAAPLALAPTGAASPPCPPEGPCAPPPPNLECRLGPLPEDPYLLVKHWVTCVTDLV